MAMVHLLRKNAKGSYRKCVAERERMSKWPWFDGCRLLSGGGGDRLSVTSALLFSQGVVNLDLVLVVRLVD